MSDFLRAHIVVSGLVQGVGYRWYAAKRAEGLGIRGYARNLFDGRVEVEAEGERGMIEEFIGQLRIGPRSAHVSEVAVEWETETKSYQGFAIR